MLNRVYSEDGTKSYCFSVGIFYEYDEGTPDEPYVLLLKHAYEDDVKYEHLSISQFFIWKASHERIIEQQEMFGIAHKTYLEYRKEYPEKKCMPLWIAAQELEAKGVLFVSEEYEPELSKQEVCNIIYPALVTSRKLDGRLSLRLGLADGIKILIKSIFLKGDEKRIYYYLKKTPNADFWGYHLSFFQQERATNAPIPLIGDDVSSLLKKGLVLAIGWTIPLPENKGKVNF